MAETKTVSAIFVKDSDKKHSILFREEGQTGDWRTDPPASISASMYIMRRAFDQLGNNKPNKVKVTIEIVE